MRSERPIVVAGGGIGGMATALALGRHGIACVVLEQARTLGAIGYGIQLGPNVFWALQALGIAEAVLAKAHRPPAILAFDARDGSEFIRIPAGREFRARFTHPYLVIHRVDLHEILVEACRQFPDVELQTGVSVDAVAQDAEGVTVATDAGPVKGRALVAADGVNSRFRQQMLGPDAKPQPSGYVAHRTLVPRAALAPHLFRPEVIMWAGHGFHIVAYPLRNETLYNIVAVFRTDTFADRMDTGRHQAEVQHTYRDAHPDMRALLELMNLERRWPIADQAPNRHWVEGRMALLGDSAHATLQSLAQGAGMSIEDAVCLANCLAGDGAVEDALKRYARLRLTRTARVQLESRQLWEVYHCGGIEADVRRDTYAGRTAREHFDCLAWLYDNPAATLGAIGMGNTLRATG